MATAETTVREIALENPASLRVFEKFGIDYCCGGRKPLAQACQEHSLELAAVLAALDAAAGSAEQAGVDWTQAPLTPLCEYIVGRHHAYVRAEIPRLTQLAQRVAARHGDGHPEVIAIQALVQALSEDLQQHLGKEEAILFPCIASLERQGTQGGPQAPACFGTVKNPIRVMMAEHDAAGEALAQIRKLSRDFTPPEGACPTYRGLYQALSEFERDLHQHVHLENNILFPRAIAMEERVI
jgi:regulator of cell morphogenesis and NO signaling